METALKNLSKLELITLLMSNQGIIESQAEVLKSQGQRLADQSQVIKSKQETIQTQDQVIEQKERVIEQKDQVIEQKERVIEQKDQVIEQKERVIEQKDQLIEQKDQVIQKQERVIEQKQTDIVGYKAQIAQLQRMLFGQKRERFESNSNQLSLPFEVEEQVLEEQVLEEQVLEEQEKEFTQKISSAGKKRSAHKGRLALPDHLPVEEIEIHPEGDLSEMICIGKEITEELEYVPARYVIRRYIRFKYAPKDKEKTGVIIGELPERVIDKGIPGSGLLASILVDKYMDHLPLYRQRQRFLRAKIPISSSTLEGWVKQASERLEVLYDHLVADIKSEGYLQADETPIRVLDSNKKGSTHKGYYWVYHDPIGQRVVFDYQAGRSSQEGETILSGFKGYLQTDGYAAYETIAKKPENTGNIIHLACWAHTRRKFEEAQKNDQKRSAIALTLIQKLYEIEATARNGGLSFDQRKELRLEKSLPVINQLEKWIIQEAKNTLPKSQIGIAMHYAIQRWKALSAYLYDGILEIDNNLVENAIRPVAIGRKNYLFAGSHAAAQRAAMIYSFFAMCKKHEVNPFEWLKYTLENIMTIKYKNIRDLYPQNFKLLSNK